MTRCEVSFVREECLDQGAAPLRSHPGWRHHRRADTGLVAKTTGREGGEKLSFLQIEFETVKILLILSPSQLVAHSIVIVGAQHLESRI